MKHVNLDDYDESVRQFVLSLPADPGGAVLEIGGRAVAHLLPVAGSTPAAGWDAARNDRRCELIDREIAGTLTPDEALELRTLQSAMLRHRRAVAPLPLDEARRLHQELLAKAAGGPNP